MKWLIARVRAANPDPLLKLYKDPIKHKVVKIASSAAKKWLDIFVTPKSWPNITNLAGQHFKNMHPIFDPMKFNAEAIQIASANLLVFDPPSNKNPAIAELKIELTMILFQEGFFCKFREFHPQKPINAPIPQNMPTIIDETTTLLFSLSLLRIRKIHTT